MELMKATGLKPPEGRSPRVLLIYPEIPQTYWSYKYALPFIGKKAVMPPLGLLTVAAMLPGDWQIRIVDTNVTPLSGQDVRNADLVMISAMIVQRSSFQAVVEMCREAGVPVVAGGPYPTSCHEEIEGVDSFVLDEGEHTLPRFLADYAAGTVKRIYRSEEKPDITKAPIPRFDLLPLDDYDTVPLQYSRGCPFDCEFCDIVHLFGRVPRVKTPVQFLREMDAALATGFHGALFIVDDNFIGNKREVKELLRAVIGWQQVHGYPFGLSTEASINLAEDEELLDLMVEAGFKMVFVGIETPVRASLSSANKGQNLKHDIVESIRKIQSKGIEVSGGFIIGFDTDPPEIFDLQIDFIRELAVPTAMVGLLMALPHTRLHARLSAEGRIVSESNGNNTHEALANFKTRLPEEVLTAGYHRVISAIYAPRTYFDRCLELLSRLPPKWKAVEKKRMGIGMREILAFPRSLFRQTFSFYGPTYLRYLLKAFLRHPDRFVQIITFAIQGHHFITITRETVEGTVARRQAAQEKICKKAEKDGSMIMKYKTRTNG